jgi:hypothetical protein
LVVARAQIGASLQLQVGHPVLGSLAYPYLQNNEHLTSGQGSHLQVLQPLSSTIP